LLNLTYVLVHEYLIDNGGTRSYVECTKRIRNTRSWNFEDEILFRGKGATPRIVIPFVKPMALFYTVIKSYLVISINWDNIDEPV